MEKFRVVVIDSGIDFENEIFMNMHYEGISILEKEDVNGKNYYISSLSKDSNGHGTAITYLLYKLLPNAHFTIVNCYENNEIGEEKLLYALTYILNNIDCDIINLSSGISACINKTKLYELCEQFKKRGTTIVAAFDNLGSITYPACFDNVIGVDGSLLCGNFREFECLENSIVNIRGCMHQQNLPWLNGTKRMVVGNSFIVPYVVKMVYDVISENRVSFEMLLQKLKSKCKRKIVLSKTIRHSLGVFPISKAVLFPFNKEINLLARFSNELPFEICDFFDVKYLGNIGRKLSEFDINNENRCKKIKNINEINWEQDFDTFILGHTKVLEYMLGKNGQYADVIISNCIKHKKNLFAFDKEFITPQVEKAFKENNLKIYYPEITFDDVPVNTIEKLYTPCVPSIAIFGTSSRQGKFTLQLKLRREFLRNKYKVGQIGTEPASLLFNFDYVYPLGYNAHNPLVGYDSIKTLNHIVMQLETEKEPDVIILGSQSHTIPLTINNTSNLAIYQQDILCAIRPDICLLCINITDTVEYIQKTVMFLESISGSKVLALILSPLNYTGNITISGKDELTNSNNLESFKDKYHNLGIPIYGIDEVESIVNNIIDYLAD